MKKLKVQILKENNKTFTYKFSKQDFKVKEKDSCNRCN